MTQVEWVGKILQARFVCNIVFACNAKVKLLKNLKKKSTVLWQDYRRNVGWTISMSKIHDLLKSECLMIWVTFSN